nr:unnamed protein product [Callosobruchus analis]
MIVPEVCQELIIALSEHLKPIPHGSQHRPVTVAKTILTDSHFVQCCQPYIKHKTHTLHAPFLTL